MLKISFSDEYFIGTYEETGKQAGMSFEEWTSSLDWADIMSISQAACEKAYIEGRSTDWAKDVERLSIDDIPELASLKR